ncbi:MAG: PAS domain S-box protein [Anaerolineae bacterium]
MTDAKISDALTGINTNARAARAYYLLLENAPLGIAQIDPEGKILDANDLLLSLLGLPPVQTLHEINVLHAPPLVQSGLKADVQQCLESGETISSERPYTSEAGKSAYLRLHVTPVTDEQGYVTSVQIIVQDITERILTEEVLREYQGRFEELHAELNKLSQAIEQSANIVVITDLKGRIEYVNPSFVEATGYTPEEVLGKNSRILKSGEQSDEYYRELWQTIMSGRQWRGEFHNRRKDGTLYWELASIAPIFDLSGQMTHFIAIKEDITERKKAEEALQLYTERLQILHEIDQSVVAARLPETIAIAAIHRIRRLIPCQRVMVMAVEADDQINLLAAASDDEIGSVADLSIYREMFKDQPLGSGMIQGNVDLSVLPHHSPLQQALYRAGMRSYLAVQLFIENELRGILHLESTEPKAFSADHIAIAREVAASLAVAIRQAQLYEQAQQELSERMEAEAKLRRHTIALEAQNAELDAFAHTVAHDLKNPVSAIVGYADILKTDYTSLPKDIQEEFLTVIARNARKMAAIIDELLLLASVRGMTEIDMHPLDMGRIVAEARGRLLHLIEEYQGQINLPDSWPLTVGYSPWVEAVWTNYISNALKYGGRPPKIELGSDIQEDSWVRFWVRDNGPGLSHEEQARLFTPFERLHHARAEGQGLGLSIVQRIVKKLGGQVGVESEGVPDQGCTFYFTLPRLPTVS